MGVYDKSSKWLIEHHGDSILRLADKREILSWRPLPPEQVQLGQLPDGLLEVQFAGTDEPTLVLLELATFPERRVFEQLTRDLTMVFLSRRVLPEALVVVLHQKGRLQIGRKHRLQSGQGWASLQATWRVVEMWKLSAEELLATNDPGIVPWAVLAAQKETTERLFQRIEEAIERNADEQEKDMLLAVTQVFGSLRYKEAPLLSLLRRKTNMLKMTDFPLVQELLTEQAQEYLLEFLETRFGPVPEQVSLRIKRIRNETRLRPLVKVAASCPDLKAFVRKLGK